MALGASINTTNRYNAAAAAVEPVWIQSLRYYFAGTTSPGYIPAHLDGQAELLKVNSIKPQVLAGQ